MFLGYQLHPFRKEVYFSRFMGCQLRERDEVTETLDGCSELTQLVALNDFISSLAVTVISSKSYTFTSLLKGKFRKIFQAPLSLSCT
jgi:hypothetical protein